MKSKPKLVTVIALLVFVFAFNFVDAQCAMCKMSAESSLSHDPKSMVRSLNTGILYLMAVPYIMLMFIFRKQLKVLFFKLKAKLSNP